MYFNRYILSALGTVILLLVSCTASDQDKAAQLYTTNCASCHLLPAIEDLPKHIWEHNVLPDMAARMGLIDSTNNPYYGETFSEQNAIMKTGMYPNRPLLSLQDWELLKNYVISLAPDSLTYDPDTYRKSTLAQFRPEPVSVDHGAGSLISFLNIDKNDGSIAMANLSGTLLRYNVPSKRTDTILETGAAIASHTSSQGISFTTHFGYLDPSERANGSILVGQKDTIEKLPVVLHRPVHTLVHDLDQDGRPEIVVSEFGHLTGKLSLLTLKKANAKFDDDDLPDEISNLQQQKESRTYFQKTLLNRPGSLRAIAKDMNNDGRDDIIAMTSQGYEAVSILYQKDDLEFVEETVLRFSSVYGSSWFELVDYDGDGDQDIITVHGDNADNSYVHKPYHGMRIHLNDGKNRFEEKFFYPMRGATKVVADDFDMDGDIDFGLLSAFPDYEREPEASFIYLENQDSDAFRFQAATFDESKKGRWLLMDSGDIDLDGDKDIVLSSFTYVITPAPRWIKDIWKKSETDLMILENTAF